MENEFNRREQNSSLNDSEFPTATYPLLKQQNNSSDKNATDESVLHSAPGQMNGGVEIQTDRLNLVYIIFLFHGIGVLLPWNTFLTIGYDYFVSYKLNGTDQGTEYRLNFFSYLTAAAQIPNLTLSLLNLFVVIKGGLHRRIYLSLLVIASICILTISFVFVDSYESRIGIRLSASIYFGLALLTVIGCGFSFRLLTKNKFYKFHVRKAVKSRATSCTDVLHEGEDICGNNSDKKPPSPNPSFAIYCAIFKEPSTKSLTIPVVARLVFIPLFWACNYQTGNEPRNFVLITNEWSFVILITFMSITHGYWSSLAMMYAPRQVDQSKSQIVGMMSGFFLVLGIASGIAFTFVEPHIVDLFGLLYH
uniref:Equilibrative nucleoside transporter 3 n=1 Tax=Meloidogyne hapla TaxID=6305 RepID=A0A1I8AWY7_MELHA